MENNKDDTHEEKNKVSELKAKLESKIRPEHIRNVKYSEQDFYGQLQNIIASKKKNEKK